jgi:type IV secretory pathway VirJ component
VINAPRPYDCQVINYEKSALRPFKKARLLELDSVSDDWQPLSSWRTPLKTNLQWLLSQTTKPSFAQVQELDGLSLVEIPASSAGNSAAAPNPGATTNNAAATTTPANSPQANNGALVLIVSDISGWTAREQALAEALTQQGASVIGFDWLRYLWAGRSAEQGQIYLERTIRHYLGVRQRDRIRLIGIGAGGGALPVLVNRLAEDVKPRIQSVALLYPAADAYIATPLPGWSNQPLSHVVVRPELEKLPASLRCFPRVLPTKPPLPMPVRV